MNRRKFLVTSTLALGVTALGGVYWKTRWRYIVIHHSAGSHGTIELLQEVHRQRQAGDPVDAIPYHYVIGNGNGLGLGEVASDWRQRFDIWGAHVSGNNSGRNFLGIGICLVGNLEEKALPPKQFQALVELTRKMMSKYGIPPENVAGHGKIDGEATKCPGRYFPFEELERAIS
ncbi:MAG: N-acetylmuramoyl-L-alanine amidase [bacterium]|nr:N-acetylmuramoyl-L-alanine amidase [bacterium]